VVLFRVDQISERAMARKRRFRFGLRDVFAGRLRGAQGRRWRIANFDFSAGAGVGAPGERVCVLRPSSPIPAAARFKKPAANSMTAGLEFSRC
jgi:hypothetical protein